MKAHGWYIDEKKNQNSIIKNLCYSKFTKKDLDALNNGVDGLRQLFELSNSRNIRCLVDAEQSFV